MEKALYSPPPRVLLPWERGTQRSWIWDSRASLGTPGRAGPLSSASLAQLERGQAAGAN